MLTRKKAFTLIELLVVIAIIGILAGMLMPALSGVRKNTRIGITKSTIKEMQAALTQYLTDRGRYPLDDLDLNSKSGASAAKPMPGMGYPTAALAKEQLTRTLVEAFDGDDFEDGPNAPYLDFKPEDFTDYSGPHYTGLTAGNSSNLMTGMTNAYRSYYCDIWQNPFHYRQNYTISYKYGMMHNLKGEVTNPNAGNCIYNPDSFDIWSDGPDVTPFTTDDIGNWD